MKWIPVSQKPEKDGFYLVAIRRDDGSIYTTESMFFVAVQMTPTSPLRENFFSMSDRVVAWMPFPKPFSRANTRGWMIAGEDPPTKDGRYFVTIDQGYCLNVKTSFYVEKKDLFTASNKVIAWRKIPGYIATQRRKTL